MEMPASLLSDKQKEVFPDPLSGGNLIDAGGATR
jgi:hypothetical protein